MPESNQFGPLDMQAESRESIKMTIDEYETIRLIDLEHFTQEECAANMNVARTTVQGIYNEARESLQSRSSTAKSSLSAEESTGLRRYGKRCGRPGCRRRNHGDS